MADPVKPSVAPQSSNPSTGSAPATNAPTHAPRQVAGVTPEMASAAAAAAASVADKVGPITERGGAIMLNNGMRRVDYIKARWAAGVSRGQIVKELKALGHEVQYQIVFAATKELKQGNAPATPATPTAS